MKSKKIQLFFVLFCPLMQMHSSDDTTLITFEDKNGNKHSFPKDFIEQHETLRLMIEDVALPDKANAVYPLPDDFSMKDFVNYYTTAKMLQANPSVSSKKTSLQDLVRYATFAEFLENIELRQKFLSLINAKLALLPADHADLIAAKKLFDHYFKVSTDFKKDIMEHGKLQATAISRFLEQFLEQYKRSNWLQRLLKQDPDAAIVFALPLANTSLPEDINDIEYTIIKDPDMRLMWDSKKTQRHVTRFFHELDDRYWHLNKKSFFKSKNFDWDKVYMMTYNNTHEKLAFAIPGKIAVTPAPLQSQPKATIINLKSIHPKAVCSHLAFSCDSNALTAVIDNVVYLINLEKNKITPVFKPQGMEILSSILVDKNILLARSTEGNTYKYTIYNKNLQLFPMSNIDYYITCHPLKDTILLMGLAQQKDGIHHIHENISLKEEREYHA